MEIVSNIALISINETLIIQLISFLVFLLIINIIMFRPLKRVMEKRDEYLDNLKQDVIQSEKKMENLKEQMRKREATVRLEAEEIKKELMVSGNKEALEIYADIRSEISGLKTENEKEIKNQLTKAKQHIFAEVEHLAVDIMEHVLNRRLVQ